MRKTLKEVNLGGVDRVIGAGLGLIKSMILVLIILMFLMITPLKSGIIAEANTEPVLRVFSSFTVVLIDKLLGSSPETRVLQHLEYWGFDRKSCDRILNDPELLFELAKSPRFFLKPIRNQMNPNANQSDDKWRVARKKVMKVIKDTKLSAREKANRILELLHPENS